jgi:alanine racemase
METVSTMPAAINRCASIESRLHNAGLPQLPRLAWLEVDLSILADNARLFRSLLPDSTQLGVVVKADGYGHGLVGTAHAALRGGADMLLVATLDEGLELRSVGFEAPIVVLFPVPPSTIEEALVADLGLVVVDWASLDHIGHALDRARTASSAAVDARGPARPDLARIHLGIDTGLTRGGFAPADAATAARALLAHRLPALAGVWSHLASPEDKVATLHQVRQFQIALDSMAAAGIDAGMRHLDASGGILAGASPPFDLVRVGLAFYGYRPSGLAIAARHRAIADRLHSALTLKARAVSIATVPRGTAVGYGGVWIAARESVIATLPLGYADGWTRLYSPGSEVIVRQRRVSLVGRVGSDAVAVDVTNIEGFDEDDEVILLGTDGAQSISVDELAQRRKSIAWEVLDDFTPRLSRVYIQEGLPVAVRSLDGATVARPGFAFEVKAQPQRGATAGTNTGMGAGMLPT